MTTQTADLWRTNTGPARKRRNKSTEIYIIDMIFVRAITDFYMGGALINGAI